MSRSQLKNKEVVVVKVGTSTITFPNGRLNFQRLKRLSMVLSKLQQQGKKVILVSSGSIAAGAGRLGLKKRPAALAAKQALAALGQAELIRIYQKFFNEFNQVVAQVLLTKDIMVMEQRELNARNTILALLDLNIIPIINENDTISIEEILFGDNDSLSATVATLVKADLLVMLSDIDGLFSGDPKKDANAQIISTVEKIDSTIENIADGKGSDFGTGGMITKITAAKMCAAQNIDTMIINGAQPENLFKVFEGEKIGTHFLSQS